jgi:hypothetical protein
MEETSNKSIRFEGQVEMLHMSTDQVRALASVACSEVFSTFSSTEAMSIREAAVQLDRSTASVGEHVATLLSNGLLLHAGERKRRSRTEALFVVAGRTMRWSLAEASPESVKAYQARFRGQMRLAEREAEAAQFAILDDPEFRNYMLYRWQKIYLSHKNVERVRQAIFSLIDLVQALGEEPPSDDKDEELVRATFSAMLLPSISASKRRSPKGD